MKKMSAWKNALIIALATGLAHGTSHYLVGYTMQGAMVAGTAVMIVSAGTYMLVK